MQFHLIVIPSETVYEKRGLLWPIARKENFINVLHHFCI